MSDWIVVAVLTILLIAWIIFIWFIKPGFLRDPRDGDDFPSDMR